jgi:CheY-like chemotaxis protein
MMPVMDGYELMDKIKSTKVMAETPVMALTALAMKSDIDRIQECGFDDYLIKPFYIEELYEKMISLLQLSESKLRDKEGAIDLVIIRDEEKYKQSVKVALEEIENTYLSLWVQANELKEFNAIRSFAEGIHTTGDKNSVRFLVDYGDKLNVHCDNYDIEKIDSSLAAFPDYLKKMREISQSNE